MSSNSIHRVVAFVALFVGQFVFANYAVAEIRYEVSGVNERLAANVGSHLHAFKIGRPSEVHGKNAERIVLDAEERVRAALRPYGYYAPHLKVSIDDADTESPVVRVHVDPGPPIKIESALVDVVGDGADVGSLVEWRSTWPLAEGQILDQAVWRERKAFAEEAADQAGYLSAEFAEHALEIDLKRNVATLRLVLDTGPRYYFGDIEFGRHVLKDGIVEYIARFEKGDPFSRRLLDKFRIDLWKTGYFTNVEVREVRRREANPPSVDLKVETETINRNYYQGSLGVGSDTGMRVQAQWSKHPMSSNGDRLDLGIGWQEQDDEFSLRSFYRLPRRERVRQFWTADLLLRNENLDLEVKRAPEDEEFVQIANGKVDEYHLRLGRLKVRNFKSGEQQAFETMFVQGLSGQRELVPYPAFPQLVAIAEDPVTGKFLKGIDSTYSFGFDYDLVAVNGKGWETRGHRERAWIFTSSKTFGSDLNFTQAYLSTRRSYLYGDRWKFILRAEVGYTDADVDEFTIMANGQPSDLSVTRLPNFYRFKAGGNSSVRGYGFEELSNNLIGSNHIITASAEVEMKFLQKWSAAAFFDIGNAFNRWSSPELRKGAGVGLRWYSIAGPIRVDFARALDIEGRPWRLHFTIGTPLL